MSSDSQRLAPGSGVYPAAALGIVVGAAILRFWGLEGGLPHLMTRPDEELIVLQTRLPAMGNFFLEWPGQHPGIPSAYIYLLWAWGEVGLRVLQIFGAAPAGDYLTVLNQAPDRLLLTERFFSASAGTATVAVLMWVVRREFGTRAALLAGLILATSVFHVRDSHSAKSDVALGLFTILSLGLLAPLARGLSRRSFWLMYLLDRTSDLVCNARSNRTTIVKCAVEQYPRIPRLRRFSVGGVAFAISYFERPTPYVICIDDARCNVCRHVYMGGVSESP